jgi:hypothetical protein
MENHYQEALKQAKRLENDIKNLLDDKNHSISRSLLDQSRKLVSDINAKRSPQSLESHLKSLQALLHQARDQGELIMDQRHISSLHGGYEDLLIQMRRI